MDPVLDLLTAGGVHADGRVTYAEILEGILAAEPGPDAMRALALLDPARLDGYSRVLHLKAWERQQGWVAARQQDSLVAVAGPAPAEPDAEPGAARTGRRCGCPGWPRPTGSGWPGRWPPRCP
jgi:hypothetical protein